MIEIEKLVPKFELRAYFPDKDTIETIQVPIPGKWNIITFHPGAFTFVCATDIEVLGSLQKDFENNGGVLLAVTTDTIYSLKMWHKTSPRVGKTNVPLVEDNKRELTVALDLLNTSTGMARRGVVITDPEGRLQYFSVFNDALGKDAKHIYRSFLGLKAIHDAPKEEGHMTAVPAGWEPGQELLKIDLNKDIGKL
jgi:peroxiredoxin (alkyl hydroperoxide reductase subunit C)